VFEMSNEEPGTPSVGLCPMKASSVPFGDSASDEPVQTQDDIRTGSTVRCSGALGGRSRRGRKQHERRAPPLAAATIRARAPPRGRGPDTVPATGVAELGRR
jgi:hypothetical protein